MGTPADAQRAGGYGADYGGDYGGADDGVALPSEIALIYQRESFSGPVITRAAAPTAAFDRAAEPDCVPAMGYGDDYGFNYGGGVDVGN